MDERDGMKYKYASDYKIYYLDDSSLASGAYYLTETLSSKELEVFYEYARKHSSGAPLRDSDGRQYLLKYDRGDFILSE